MNAQKKEDTPSMSTGAVADKGGSPLKNIATFKNYKSGDTWKMFDVCNDCFSKFSKGRQKFERWSKFLNLEDDMQKSIYDYAKTHRKNTIVLRCSETGALRAIRSRSACGL